MGGRLQGAVRGGLRGASMLRFVALSVVLVTNTAVAQEDTAPPALLEFSIAPVVFDAGLAPVEISWCATARDEFTGVNRISLLACRDEGSAGFQCRDNFGGPSFPAGTRNATGCGQFTFEQYRAYGT